MARHEARASGRLARAGCRVVVTIGLLGVALGCGLDPDPVIVGTLERDRVELVAEVSEPIVAIHVREGDRVAAGQLVLRFDDERARAQVARARGSVERARARLAELERGPRFERIQQARALLSGAEGTLRTSRRDLERAGEMRERRVTSEQALDQARARYEEALARRDELRARLRELERGTTDEELEQARASVAEARGVLDEARIQLERMSLVAPVEGRIDALPYELGERPPAGGVAAVMLSSRAPYARIYVPEPLRARVATGAAAKVEVDGLEGAFDARIRWVSHEASFTPFYALTERDRGRLVYLAEADLLGERAASLPTGIPVVARIDAAGSERAGTDAVGEENSGGERSGGVSAARPSAGDPSAPDG